MAERTARRRTKSTRKTRYWDKKGKPGPWDAIVIGSGMGGMTSAAILASLGRRVLVLEQHYTPGGFTHVFRRPGGYHWDVGVHAVGEVTPMTVTGRALARLTENRLVWSSLGPEYDIFDWPDDFKIAFPNTPTQFRENLIRAFPDEERAIDDYLVKVRQVSNAMRNYYLSKAAPRRAAGVAERLLARDAQRFLEMRTKDVLDTITDNAKLKAVLVSQWAYHGAPPSISSFAIQALVTRHFQWGAYYPRGGSGAIAQELLRTVAEAGGWTRIRADVEQLLVEGEAVVGVRLTTGEEIRAPKVISAVGVASTVTRLLPEPWREAAWARDVSNLRPAPAHVCLYLGFKGDIRRAGAGSANRWFYHTWDTEQDAWDVSDPSNLPSAPVLYCSFPSLKDPDHDPGPDQTHTGEVVTFVPWSAFEPWMSTRWHHRGEDYEAFKKAMTDRLLGDFLNHMPDLEPMLDHIELATPLSTHHFCRPMEGSIYGIMPTPERFQSPWLRPQAPLENLYFSGSEVASVGVMGAMVGGVLGAVAAEPIEALKWLAAC